MERKQILIEIIGRFVDEGIKAATRSLREFLNVLRQVRTGGAVRGGGGLGNIARDAAQATQNLSRTRSILGLITQALGKLGRIGRSALGSGLVAGVGAFKVGLLGLTAALKVGQLGLKGLSIGFNLVKSAVTAVLSPFTFFAREFFRFATFAVTSQVFSFITNGFREMKEAMFDANAAVSTTRQTFAALSGGGIPIANQQLEILRALAIESGVSFAELAQGTRRFVAITGKNLQTFTDLVRRTIELAFLDPEQGIRGAAFAITEALEGTPQGFRSIANRFEIPKSIIRKALAETGDSAEQLKIIFESLGIGPNFIEEQAESFQFSANIIKSVLVEIGRVAGQPIFEKIEDSVIALRKKLVELEPELFGIAQAIGEFALQALESLGLFNTEFINTLDPFAIFQAGVDLMRSLVEGIITGLTQFVIPAITTVAAVIASFFIGGSPPEVGPLSRIIEGGRETIKAFVEGLVSGLNSQALQQLAQEITNGIINLEQQEVAGKKTIRNLERFLKEAQARVRQARERLQLFNIESADIPERFTRARKRELQLQILAAQREAQRRRDALDAAKEQQAILRAMLSAQRQVLTNIERIFKATLKAEEEAEDVAKSISKEFSESDIDLSAFNAAQEEAKNRAAEILAPLKADLIAAKKLLQEAFAGRQIGETAGRIVEAIANIKEFAGLVFEFISGFAENFPEIIDAFNQEGLAAGIIEVGKALGTSFMEAFGAAIRAVFDSITQSILDWMAENRRKFDKFLEDQPAIIRFLLQPSGEGPETNNPKVVAERLRAEYDEALRDKPAIVRFLFEIRDKDKQEAQDVVAAQTLALQKQISGAEPDTQAAAKKGFFDPIVSIWNDITDELITNSIVPEMLGGILTAFINFNELLLPVLTQLESEVSTSMGKIRMDWEQDWLAMARIAEATLARFAGGNSDFTSALTAGFNNRTGMNVNLNLDAAETSRLMRQGAYQATIDIYGQGN